MAIKKLLWPIAFLLSLISAFAGIRVQGIEGDAGFFEPLFTIATVASTLILLGLLIDYRRDVGSLFRGSDSLRMRVGVITVGDIAIIVLALGFFPAGIGLFVITLALFAHGTFAQKDLLALHAEWDAEKAASEARRADLVAS